ncbi:LPXTG cell wall anchor domain-containing protein [Listeria monocytogenes]|nr:LPXTG cell wall anchor domain-containing protein [Listeria monocytogenes]
MNGVDNNMNQNSNTLTIKSGHLTTASISLPKTGDETNSLPIVLGVFCIGLTVFLRFRRTLVK